MSKATRIVYTKSFENQANDLNNHLSYYTNTDATDKVVAIIERFESKVKVMPLSCPESQILTEYGVYGFREYINDGVRIFYRIDDRSNPCVVEAHIMLSQKQDVPSALIDYCLRHR